MDFTIYTFGDVEIFRAALTGVAMIFSPGQELFASNSGGLGLGALVGLALMIGLASMLIQGVIHQKVEVGGFMVLIIVYVLLFVPKFDVNIEDYNGAGVAKVDNVPLGIALPASMVSATAKELSDKMGTAFSTVNGYPNGMANPQSLSSPLKLLFSLRNGVFMMRDKQPRLTTNINNLIAYCAAGRPGASEVWATMTVSSDPISAMAQLIQNNPDIYGGMAMYIPKGATTAGLAVCGGNDPNSAAQGVLNDMDDLFKDDTGVGMISSILTAGAAKEGAGTVVVNGNTASVNPITMGDVDSALMMLSQSSSSSAVNFVKQALLGPYSSAAFRCAGGSGNPEDWAQCMPFGTANLQWTEDAAAGGSFFQRIMFSGMNALFFIWICLSPVVATVMLMMGQKGVKLAGSYMLFGAWSVSWYVGASVVNFYMLKQVQYETSMLGGIGMLNNTTMQDFFMMLSTKLAVAGDLMASVPLIMMTVLSGSVYGMVSMSQRMGGADRYNEKVNTPDPIGAAPLIQQGAHIQQTHGGFAVNQAIGAGSSIDISHAMKLADANSIQSTKTTSEQVMSGLANTVRDSMSGSQVSSHMRQLGKTLASMGFEGKTVASSDGRVFTINKDNGFTTKDSNWTGAEGTRSAEVGIGLGGGAGGGGKGGKGGMLDALPIKAGASASDTNSAGERHGTDRLDSWNASGGATRGASQADEHGARLNESWDAKDAATVAKEFRRTAGEEYDKTFAKQSASVDAFGESGGRTQSTEWAAGGKVSWTPQEAVARLSKLGMAFQADTEQAKAGWTPLEREQYESAKLLAMTEYSGVAGGELLAQYKGLEAAASVGPNALSKYLDTTRQAFGADVGNAHTRASGMTAESNRDRAATTEAAVRADAGGIKTPMHTATMLAGGKDPGSAARGGEKAVSGHHEKQVAGVDVKAAENDTAIHNLQIATHVDPGMTRRSLNPAEKSKK